VAFSQSATINIALPLERRQRRRTAIDQETDRCAGDMKAGVGPAAGAERIATANKLQLHRSDPPPTSPVVSGPLTRPLNCIYPQGPNFKSLGLLKSLPNKRARARMMIETIALAGFVFAAVTLAAIRYERRMDVLHGPYIQGRADRRESVSLQRLSQPIRAAANRLGWKVRPVVYLATITAC
jgi:hypothetical protein